MPRPRSFEERRKQGWREMTNPDRMNSGDQAERLQLAKLVGVGEADGTHHRPTGLSKTYRLADCVRIYDEWWRKCQRISRLADRTRCQHEANQWVERCKQRTSWPPHTSIRTPRALYTPSYPSIRSAPPDVPRGAIYRLSHPRTPEDCYENARTYPGHPFNYRKSCTQCCDALLRIHGDVHDYHGCLKLCNKLSAEEPRRP